MLYQFWAKVSRNLHSSLFGTLPRCHVSKPWIACLLEDEGPYETRQTIPTEAILDQPAPNQPGSDMQTHDWAPQRLEEMPNEACSKWLMILDTKIL